MENNKMIRFTMNKIVVEQFAILSDNPPIGESQINFSTRLTFKADASNKVLACESKFVFEEDGKPFMKLDVQCNFSIEENDWNELTTEDQVTVIPKGFLCHIAMHTIGTARGVLHVKTESTPFNIYIIPPINVEEIVKDDYVVNNH